MTNDIQPETPQTAHPKRLGGGRTFRGTASRSEKGNIDEVSTTSETSGVPMVRSQIDRMIRVVERSRPEIGIQLAGPFDQVAQRRMTHPRLEPEATMNFDLNPEQQRLQALARAREAAGDSEGALEAWDEAVAVARREVPYLEAEARAERARASGQGQE